MKLRRKWKGMSKVEQRSECPSHRKEKMSKVGLFLDSIKDVLNSKKSEIKFYEKYNITGKQ